MGVSGLFGKEIQKEEMHLLALALGGFDQTADDAVILQSFLGTGSLNNVAHDHNRPKTALGQVVGGRNVGMLETGEETILFLVQESLAKAFGSDRAQGAGAIGHAGGDLASWRLWPSRDLG